MITYTTSKTDDELRGILNLQKRNLALNLAQEEVLSQGFVTVSHSFEDLRQLHDIEPHLIAKDEDEVIAYLLAMTAKSKADIPILLPMFDVFDRVQFRGKTIADYHYLVVGQVCVDKRYRGQGILDACYAAYREHFQNKYDFAITEIAISNPRSIKAHHRIGFTEVHRYLDPDGVDWSIVAWEW